MKKVSSVVWQFFDRIEEDKRCVGVLCKLCDTVYKYFGNTTNLRTHLVKKHPLQWEFRQNNLDGKTLDDSTRSRTYEDDESNQSMVSTKPTRTKFVSVEGGEISEIENDIADDDITTINMVRQMHEDEPTDEEWLEDDTPMDVFKTKHKKAQRKIKREIVTPPHWSSKLPRQESPKKLIGRQKSESKDEYSVFGEYIANKLRKFKAPRTRGNIQQLITTILWQAEYGLYDKADSVKKVLLSSMQSNEPVQQETEIQNEEYTLHVERVEDNNQSVEADTEMV